MNRQTTRLIVPFYEQEEWDEEQRLRDLHSLSLEYEAFAKRQNEFIEERKAGTECLLT